MKLFGRALTVLRTRAGLSQAEAGAAFGTTGPGWGKYELGQAPSIFRPSVQARLAAAVGATAADLGRELAGLMPPKPADEDWTEGGRFLEAPEAV